mgnify:CR=1 FL=1
MLPWPVSSDELYEPVEIVVEPVRGQFPEAVVPKPKPGEVEYGTTKAEELMIKRMRATTMGRERNTMATIVAKEERDPIAAVPIEERATLARIPSLPTVWAKETGGGVFMKRRKPEYIQSKKWAKERPSNPKAFQKG